MGWGDVDWIGLAQDSDKWRALVNEPSGSISAEKLSSDFTTGGISNSAELHS
jgi:hypothetical protein